MTTILMTVLHASSRTGTMGEACQILCPYGFSPSPIRREADQAVFRVNGFLASESS